MNEAEIRAARRRALQEQRRSAMAKAQAAADRLAWVRKRVQDAEMEDRHCWREMNRIEAEIAALNEEEACGEVP